ncbi:MAG: MotA/TolQ/ExbB proton channel family protein [Planctomycetota bacterium]|nr:MotA/TolQ/ExbB proton channel family protein [Planctomycetota bacterium]MDA1159977.1 MotA/TolQ/ExbB proton channel family protein [Planctomycetota bacterium]
MSTIVYLALLLGQAPEAAPQDAAPVAVAADGEANAAASAPAAADSESAPGEVTMNEDGDNLTESDEGESDSGLIGKLDEISQSGAIGFLRKGGLFMWPILFLGILAAGVIIERYRSLKMLTSDSGSIRTDVQQLLHEDRIEEAMKLCDSSQGPVPAILSAGLRKFLVLRRLNYDPAKIEEQVVKAMDDYGVHVVAALEKHLPVLATVSSVAPMLGFLGTVAGMVTSFEEIVARMGETNIVEAAAGGISVALLTTAFGLIIGIPAFMAFNYFSSVINRFVLEIEESATDLIESVTLQLALQKSTEQPGST